MTTIGSPSAATPQLPAMQLPSAAATEFRAASDRVADARFRPRESKAEDVREKFTQFVGETFFGQMIKAMRSTVEKPAYFHGGRGEEVFQGQLDLQLAEHFAAVSADKFSEPMFERQFPDLAESLKRSDLQQLDQLPRR